MREYSEEGFVELFLDAPSCRKERREKIGRAARDFVRDGHTWDSRAEVYIILMRSWPQSGEIRKVRKIKTTFLEFPILLGFALIFSCCA